MVQMKFATLTIRPIFLIFFFLVFPLAIQGCTSGEPTSAAPSMVQQSGAGQAEAPQIAKVGYIAPDFALNNIAGKPVSLKSYRGKVVLVNFWATWCDPCKWEMPSMEQLYKSQNRLDFEILAISTDEDGLRSVFPFQQEFKFSFPILLDPELKINDGYGVRNIPTTMILDRKGVITNRFFGAVDWMDPKQANLIQQLINDRT